MSEREQDFSTTGVERVIPIRFVQMRESGTTPLLVSLERLSRLVGNANFAFQPAGVQFYIKSIESYQMPNFSKARNNQVDIVAIPWSATLYNELVQVFPDLPVNGSPNMTGNRFLIDFLNLATIDLGKPGEITAFIGQSTSGATARLPWRGRLFLSGSGTMNGQEWNFTHELGHYFGLPHTFEGDFESDFFFKNTGNVGVRDPSTNQTLTRADFWDLVYREPTASSIQFLTSKTQASGYPQVELKPKDLANNCTTNASCTVSCTSSNNVVFTTDSAGAQGMGIKLAGDDPPTTYRRGYNAMGYEHPNCVQPFTPSQILQIRRVLRHDIPILNLSVANSGKRNELGQWARSAPQMELDVDGDGKRDIGFYEPPISFSATGKFTIFKSSGGQLIADLGKLGDVPVLADYDDDGKTDLAVWRNNGPNGDDPFDNTTHFYFCASSNNPGCTSSPTWRAYGARGDVPLPGARFGGGAPELAVYRSSDNQVHWRRVNTFTEGSIPFPGSANSLGREPLVGYFDGDKKTDVAIYNALTGSFNLALSSQNWANVQRTFPSSVVVTGTSSTGADRARGILMRHAYRKGLICTGIDCSWARKHVAQVWDSHTGEFHTFWDPAYSSTVSTCQLGQKDDIPLSGFVDLDADNIGDFVVHRPSNHTFYVKRSSSGGCAGSTSSFTWLGFLTYKGSIPLLLDNNADGKDELFILDGYNFNYRFFSSSSNYTETIPAGGSFSVGVRAMLL